MNKELNDVTAIIKTFLRDEYFYACVQSLRDKYPAIKIMVADDGPEREEKTDFALRNCEAYYALPFDTSLTEARNILVRRAQTPYVLIGDDDFFYDDGCDLVKLRHLMEVADIAGGRIRENGDVKNYQGSLELKDGGIVSERLMFESDCKVHKGVRYKPTDLTFNFFLAHRDKLPPWDQHIQISYEHEDYFLTCKDRGLRVVFTPDVIVTHKPGHVDWNETDKKFYLKYRNRRGDREYFMKKWGAKFFQDMNGFKDSL